MQIVHDHTHSQSVCASANMLKMCAGCTTASDDVNCIKFTFTRIIVAVYGVVYSIC